MTSRTGGKVVPDTCTLRAETHGRQSSSGWICEHVRDLSCLLDREAEEEEGGQPATGVRSAEMIRWSKNGVEKWKMHGLQTVSYSLRNVANDG